MSFFGFDTSQSPSKQTKSNKAKANRVGSSNGIKGGGRGQQSKPLGVLAVDGDALDALLEQKYSHGGLGVGSDDDQEAYNSMLQSDNLELNDETFGGNALESVDGEFDFGNQPAKQALLSGASTSSSRQQQQQRHQPIPQHLQPQPRQTMPIQQQQQQQRAPPSFMSLDQVEAQLRGGVVASGGPQQPPFPMHQRPPPHLSGSGFGGMMPRPSGGVGGNGIPMMMNQQYMMNRPPPQPQMGMMVDPLQQQQQAFMMRPPPHSGFPGQQQRPPPHMVPPHQPQPIVIDGISVTPVEISNQEKDMVFQKLQVIQPMFMHIDTLMNTIFKIGGEKENENLRRLNDVKNILRAQLELINRGIFVMRHETVLQVHGSLLQFFQYGETLMKNAAASGNAIQAQAPVKSDVVSPRRPPSPVRAPSPDRPPSPKRGILEDEEQDELEEDEAGSAEDIDLDESKDEGNAEKEEEKAAPPPPQQKEKQGASKVLKIVKKKKQEEETTPVVTFDEGDFPALGKISLQAATVPEPNTKKPKEPVIRLAVRGNQKQRREEKQKQEQRLMGAASLLDQDPATVVEDLSIPRRERYSGLMRKHEKELIAKIQISQLVTDDPLADDFYFQMKSLRKKEQELLEGATPSATTPLGSGGGSSGKSKKKGAKWQISAGQLVQGKTGAALSNQMQQQMKRLIESRRALKPREGNLSLEGALGKIAVKSNRAPKQALEVPPPSSSATQLLSNTLSSMADLKCAEKIFDAVLALEFVKRKKVAENSKAEVKEKWNEEKQNAVNELWRCMAPSDSIPLSTPHPLVCAMNRSKGLYAASRGLALLDTKQCLGFFSIMFTRLECLNVCNYKLGDESEKVEAFMTHILPVFTSIVTEADMSVLLVLMRIVLERHNLVWLAQCRVGLVLLTMILSRAELVKQSSSSGGGGEGEAAEGENQVVVGVSDSESSMWSEIYSFLFSSFQGQFSVLFRSDTLPDDQVYVWQFLSAMAVGASGLDQQKILVTEMRENIIQTAKTNHPKALENVNLFLNALGLNITASQLAAMSG